MRYISINEGGKLKKEFNQAEYIKQYKKDKYKRYLIEIPKDIAKDIDIVKEKHNLSNRDILIKGYEVYKKNKD